MTKQARETFFTSSGIVREGDLRDDADPAVAADPGEFQAPAGASGGVTLQLDTDGKPYFGG